MNDSNSKVSEVLVVGHAEIAEDIHVLLRQEGFKVLQANPHNGRVVVFLRIDEFDENLRREVSVYRKQGCLTLCSVSVELANSVNLIADIGCDDYIFRPYDLSELLLRIRRLVSKFSQPAATPLERRRHRRRREDRQEPSRVSPDIEGVLCVKKETRDVIVGGETIRLTPKEFRLLSLLASNRGHLFSHQEILHHLWPNTARASSEDLQQYVHLLRKKIEPDPHEPRYLLTMKGLGYKLACTIEWRL